MPASYMSSCFIVEMTSCCGVGIVWRTRLEKIGTRLQKGQEIIIKDQMFQNSYQNGTYFEVFDPKTPQQKMKNLFKVQNITGNNKIFDKQLKTYVLDFSSANAKICFPRQDRKDLYLIQQYLNLQIFLYQEMSWTIELAISDLNKTKRRVILSSNHKLENKPFFIRFPCLHVQEGIWANFIVDLYSFIGAFKGQTYRSLDSITITGFFKLRRIFTTQQPPIPIINQPDKQIILLPKTLHLPTDAESSNCLITYEQKTLINQEIHDTSQNFDKRKSNFQSRGEISTPKTQVMRTDSVPYHNEKKFLADTDGHQRKKKHQKNSSLEAVKGFREKPAASTDKKYQKRNASKRATQHRDDKKKAIQQQEKQLVKGKLNPWRLPKMNEIQTETSQLSSTKPKRQRKIESAESTLFKTKNNLANRHSDFKKNNQTSQKNDQYSDSEYVELSQKFSTLTENRFFKAEMGTQKIESVHQDPDQIEQHIEIQSNECQSQNRKLNQPPQQLLIKKLKFPNTEQSIDSLEKMQAGKAQPRTVASMMNSYYGFGQKIVNKYMYEAQRPYSPPIYEKDPTEEGTQRNEADDKQVQVIYDPVLNCYYDHKTHTYYELKN